jgi:hypothetical protein
LLTITRATRPLPLVEQEINTITRVTLSLPLVEQELLNIVPALHVPEVVLLF